MISYTFLHRVIRSGISRLLLSILLLVSVSCASSKASEQAPQAAQPKSTDFVDPAEAAQMVALVKRAQQQFQAESKERNQIRDILDGLEGISGLPLVQRDITHRAEAAGLEASRVVPGPTRTREYLQESTITVESRAPLQAIVSFLEDLEGMGPKVRIDAVLIQAQHGSTELHSLRATISILIRRELPQQTTVQASLLDEQGIDRLHCSESFDRLRTMAMELNRALEQGRKERKFLDEGLAMVNEGRILAGGVVGMAARAFRSPTGILRLHAQGSDGEVVITGYSPDDRTIERTLGRMEAMADEIAGDFVLAWVEDRRVGDLGFRRVFAIEGTLGSTIDQ